VTGILTREKRREFGTQTHGGEGHMKMVAEIDMTQ
jgi:hypothetical protein